MLAEFQRRTKPLAPAAPAKPSKYRNEKVEVDGVRHDSKKEARRWQQLQMMEKAGQITGLKRQVAFELAPGVKFRNSPRAKPALRYVADAVYVRDGETIIEDCKSPPTRQSPIYRAKKHLMLSVLGLEITEL